ncbi:hypothetical protein VPH35_075330 [Triticum aestivum]|uniref:protein SMAX1-LIKE 3-like n=1 Tax=Triticum aestivum TaxID=4565 RepID=UPI00084390E6|nr:protein SMAX1-LIKE 3-like [Triticum aestivum]
MRVTGGQEHALGEEAAAVVRQAVSLARQRGHAQVTPLHIASAMLSASPAAAAILRAACARFQFHSLQQHNALDPRLDVALGRLPLARPASVVHHSGDRVEPAPSNAFLAALKRAQAHRGRRGALVGELEQLVLSILDDPSVDRVMRAAGFSSSQSQAGASVVGAAISWEQPIRASCDVPKLQPSVVAHVVPDGSECQAGKAKLGTAQTAFLCGTEVVATTAILPPWLHRYKCTKYTSTTYCGASLQANSASRRPKFTELTAQNFKILCDALELRVPRHANIIPGISSTVLRCRSGVTRRRAGVWPTTWLLFRGRDSGGKTAVARELARLVFGSYAEFTTLQVQGNPDIPAHTGKLALKRQRPPDIDGDGNGGDVGARLFEAIAENPHRVILINGVNRLDGDSEMRIKNATAGVTMARGCNDDVVGLEDAIVVMSSDVFDSRFGPSASSPRVKRRRNNTDMEVRPRRGPCWDLNVCAVDGEEEEDSLAHDEGVISVVDGVFLFN